MADQVVVIFLWRGGVRGTVATQEPEAAIQESRGSYQTRFRNREIDDIIKPETWEEIIQNELGKPGD